MTSVGFIIAQLIACLSIRAFVDAAVPSMPQAITWLYTKNLQKASHWLESVVGLPVAFNGAPSPPPGFSDCRIHKGSNAEFFIGICDIREPPTSMDEAAVTITLVAENGRVGVDSWYSYLASKSNNQINVTKPSYSIKFNCYAFNFYNIEDDVLGFYRFEVQVFEDPSWPKPKPRLTTEEAPPAPQIVTWFYTQDLSSSTKFFTEALQFPLVLDQGPCTIHSHPYFRSYFLGVCNSRPAPSKFAPVMYSFIAPSTRDVSEWHDALPKGVIASHPQEVPQFKIFAFEFKDEDKRRLGWYRFECAHMDKTAWPPPTRSVIV